MKIIHSEDVEREMSMMQEYLRLVHAATQAGCTYQEACEAIYKNLYDERVRSTLNP